MSEPRFPPEIPYPFPPGREPPRRTDPVVVPMVDAPSPDPAQRLLERRTILVGGPLDHAAVTHLCAQLMALDGRSASDVEVIVNSPGGPIADIAAVLDVIELMRGRVNVTCTGMAHGTAAVLVACATGERRAGRHARLSLRLPQVELPVASSTDVARLSEEVAAARRHLVGVLAAATGQPAGVIARELDEGAAHDPADALRLGLIDRVLEPTTTR
jgi:ATP-dependent Clp protease protease subunit